MGIGGNWRCGIPPARKLSVFVAGWEGTSNLWSLPVYLGECLLTIIPVLTFLPPDNGSWTAGLIPLCLFSGSVARASMPKAQRTLVVTGWWGRGSLLVFFTNSHWDGTGRDRTWSVSTLLWSGSRAPQALMSQVSPFICLRGH